jgi:hypothetical protein
MRLVVYGRDGMDEVSLGASTLVGELKNGEISEYEIHPEDFGLTMASHRALRVDTPEQSRDMVLAVLDNQAGPPRDIVALNAGIALYAANVATHHGRWHSTCPRRFGLMAWPKPSWHNWTDSPPNTPRRETHKRPAVSHPEQNRPNQARRGGAAPA